MFWLRFFGSKRRISRNSFEELGLDDSIDQRKPGPRKSIAYVPVDLYNEDLAPLDGSLAAARRRSSHRRSAIDLSRTEPSVDFGSGTGVRLSVDAVSGDRQYWGSLLATYTDFVTKHKGRHAKIIRATNRQNQGKVILKVFDKNHMSGTQREDVTKELHILKRAEGYMGVVQLVGSYEDDNFVSLILDECPGGTLLTRIAEEGGRLTEERCVREVVAPLVKVICWLHENGIVHRDLKPEHILFESDGSIKVVDFATACVVGKDPLISREGTLAYMAPEMLTKPTPEEIFHDVICNGIDESELPAYSEKVDLWSLGVIIVEALTGRQPFLADRPEMMLRVQQKELLGDGFGGVLDFLHNQEFLSLEGQDFLSQIFRMKSEERPFARELLHHPWLELWGNNAVF